MPANILNFDAFAMAAGKREERITGDEGEKVVEAEVEKEEIIKIGDGETVAVEEEEKEMKNQKTLTDFF